MIEERHRVEPSAMRQAIARLMTESKQQTPHFYLSTVVEMDALLTTADQANSLRCRSGQQSPARRSTSNRNRLPGSGGRSDPA